MRAAGVLAKGHMFHMPGLDHNDSNMFPHVENHFADCEQISYLCEPIKFYALIRQFWTEK